MTAGTDTQSEVYDASGPLLLRTDSTGPTLFLGETELHQAAGSTAVSAVRTYMLAGKTIAERSTQPGVSGNGDLQWLGTDVDGTADVKVDASTGAVTRRYSDPFGNSRGSIPAWSSDHGFLNKTDDTSTGLTQLGARVYDATLGRFLTVDPILAPQNPVQDNGYAYSANNPITNADPSGTCWVSSSDSFNHNTNCSTGSHNSDGSVHVTHGNAAAAGADTYTSWTADGGPVHVEKHSQSDDANLKSLKPDKNGEINVARNFDFNTWTYRPESWGGYNVDFAGAVNEIAEDAALASAVAAIGACVATCTVVLTVGESSEVLSASDVDAMLSDLRAGRTAPNLEVDSEQQMRELYEKLTPHSSPVKNEYPGRLGELPDGTRIGLRPDSKSGGSTIDVFRPDGTKVKVHLP